MNNLISVILPIYNAQKYLSQAIESILNQTYKNFEFIIINDGSKDESLKIIRRYMKIDERIILIDRENKGLIYSLNEGIKKAKGKYIARMDADDICLSERFKKQIELLEECNLDICGGHFLLINQEDNIQRLNLTPLSHEACFLSLASKVPFAHPSVMMRKNFLEINNLLYGQSDYKIAEDLDLWIRMYEKGAKFGNVNDIIFKYRVLENSLSKVNSTNLLKETKDILNEFLHQNKDDLINILNNIKISNEEEQSILVRIVFKIYIKKFKFFKAYRYFKNIDKRIIICTILSEFKN